MKRTATTWCALLAAIVVGTAVVVGSARHPFQDFELRPCPGGRTPARAECGRLTVFENRAAGRGRRIHIHFMVIRAEKPRARQALFMFAGGPGQASTDMAGVVSGWASPLRAQQDVVLVDQRGTGRSHPLDCDFGAEANPASAFGHVFDPLAVARCRAVLEQDADLTQYTTDAAVDDVEDIRARLGYDSIALFGGSYGTRMAQTYLRRYPLRVRAVVLDGVVPFDMGGPLTYARTAQQALDRVFAACRAEPTCRRAHPEPETDMAAILGRLAARPATAVVVRRSGQAVNVTMSAADFGYAVRGIMYDAGAGLELPALLRRTAATGNLNEFAQRYFDREVRMEAGLAHGLHFSVFCSEDIPYPTEQEIGQATAGTFLGRYLFDEYRNACAAWSRGAIRPDARTPVSARVPTLLVSGWFDPSTPPEFAERVAKSLSVSRLIVSYHTAHGSVGGCAAPAALHLLATGSLRGLPDVCR